MGGIGTKNSSDQFGGLKDSNELIKESIFNILNTRRGERLGNPTFGSDLYTFIFNPNIDYYWDAIKLEIIKNIEEFEPRVQVLNVEFAQADTSLTLFVVFLILETQELDSLAVEDISGI